MLLLLLASTAGCLSYSDDSSDIVEEIPPNTVYITSKGFTPRQLTVGVNETVTWVNKDSLTHWVASAQHPTHTIYCENQNCGAIGSYQGSLACLGEGETKDGAFDACRPLNSGESYEFKFNKTGTWQYHDHLDYGLVGSIRVE